MAAAIDLSKMSHAEKDALILSLLPLIDQLASANARIAELEARLLKLERPTKTPKNSSVPPSRGQKGTGSTNGAEKPRRKGRPGVGRALHPAPDRVAEFHLTSCPHCATAWPDQSQTPQEVYDRIEIPPIQPDVTRVRLFGGCCASCGKRAVAAAQEGLEPGSPFGKSIAALVVYLHYAQAIGMERLRLLMDEIFNLSISGGALSNILARAQAPLEAAAASIAEQVIASDAVASDETSARVMKKPHWEWVFITAVAVLHIIRPTRAASVVRDLFGTRRPRVWLSDSLKSQRGHSETWQMCLAHLLRDAQYAIDCGDADFSFAFKRLLLCAIAIGRRRPKLKDATLEAYRASLDRRLTELLARPCRGEVGQKLKRRILRDRQHLFVFVTDRTVDATNNVSERMLRPSVIFRKVTNGFRSQWGADTYAAFRSVVSTAKLNKRAILQELKDVLARPVLKKAIAQPG
jgi:transposase